MDLGGVVAAKYDSVDIFGIWYGTVFVWPDPWMDIWEESGTVYWEDVWRNMWSISDSESQPELKESPDGNQQLT